MNINKLFFVYIIFICLLSSQSIYHDSIKNNSSRIPIQIDVFTDLDNNAILQYDLFYRLDNQISFFQQPMIKGDNGYYFSIIPANHNISGYIEYFILLELLNGNIISIPQNSPDISPLLIEINDENYSNINSIDNLNLLNAEVSILSPDLNENVMSEDLVISLSYFQLESLDIGSIEIYIDDINLTDRSIIKSNHLILEPPKLDNGRHNIIVNMTNTSGVSFKPIQWSFNIIDDEMLLSQSDKFKYNGRYWSNYLNNTIDTLSKEYSTFNFNFNGKSEWINFSTRLKKSSLENIYEQPKDRYLLKFDSKNFKFNYGDFYPNLGKYGLNGNRIRGVGIVVDTKYFQMHVVQGELNRAVQGNPNDGAMVISDFSDQYNDTEGTTESTLTLSRNNYTFERSLSGLRIAFGDKDKANFGLNILKSKDDINSVNQFVTGSIISLDKFLEYYQYNSDQFTDMNGDGLFTVNEDSLYNDYNDNDTFDDIIEIQCAPEFTKCEPSTVVIGTYLDTISVKQIIWDIELVYENKNNLIDILNNTFPSDYSNINIVELENQWEGNSPEDNFVIGTDMNLNFKNKVKIKSGISMSLVNTNIWNPIKTVEDFDTYADEYEDCYYGRTYSNLNSENDCTEEMNDDDMNSNCDIGEYYWYDCLAFTYVDGINDTEIVLIIDESGIELNSIPDPESFTDIFHYNFDAVPLIPFYSLLQKMQNDETIKISDILNSPEIAYNLDFILSFKRQKVQFGIKQIGASFNSLGNPYLQKDSREKYFSDTFRLFKNKLFLSLKWQNIKNGLISGSSSSSTEKYDINISVYPGINLPSITFGYGEYKKEGGDSSSIESIPEGLDSTLLDELANFDSRLHTKTSNINFTLSQNFKISKYNHSLSFTYFDSDKEDLLYDELILSNSDYISPRSKSESMSLNLKTTYNSFWSSNIYMTNNYFDFAQITSEEFYQKQDFSMMSLGFNYTDNSVINKIGASLDYSIGKGSTNYNQFGIRLLAKFKLYDNLNIWLDYNNRYKTIENETEENSKYNNSTVKVNLSYKF